MNGIDAAIVLCLLAAGGILAWLVYRTPQGKAPSAEDLAPYRHCSINVCVAEQLRSVGRALGVRRNEEDRVDD